jgi:hypothetical protein
MCIIDTNMTYQGIKQHTMILKPETWNRKAEKNIKTDGKTDVIIEAKKYLNFNQEILTTNNTPDVINLNLGT